jgi:GGDEF domain-containing protein
VLAEEDARELTTVALRLEEEFDSRTAASGLKFPVSLTVGSVHSKPPHGLSLDELLQRADEFIYERKHRTTPRSA